MQKQKSSFKDGKSFFFFFFWLLFCYCCCCCCYMRWRKTEKNSYQNATKVREYHVSLRFLSTHIHECSRTRTRNESFVKLSVPLDTRVPLSLWLSIRPLSLLSPLQKREYCDSTQHNDKIVKQKKNDRKNKNQKTKKKKKKKKKESKAKAAQLQLKTLHFVFSLHV